MFGAISPLDGEALKGVLLALLSEAGVDLLLHTLVTDALTEGERIHGLVVHNKGGRAVIPAQVVVDATGDADVAARARAEFEFLRGGDRDASPGDAGFGL
jgi:flavin-dependent dehydrogenase